MNIEPPSSGQSLISRRVFVRASLATAGACCAAALAYPVYKHFRASAEKAEAEDAVKEMASGAGRSSKLAKVLRDFGAQVQEQLQPLLEHYKIPASDGGFCFLNHIGEHKRIRPWCDAIEIASMFGAIPSGHTSVEWIDLLQSFQDRETGLVPEHTPEDRKFDPLPPTHPDYAERYNTMIVNYALECLGSRLSYPVKNATVIPKERLLQRLRELNWKTEAWKSGHWVDCYASSLLPSIKYFKEETQAAALMTWLNAACNPKSGMWGEWNEKSHWLQPVNGFYRLTRGTYAQFGLPLPYPARSIDTVLRHAGDSAFFSSKSNACDVLDVVHPLWLCLQQTDYRRDEAKAWMATRLPGVLNCWKKNQGFSFDLTRDEPSLQGTEMWLSIIFIMAKMLGIADELNYQPRGVHRLEPACSITPL